MIKFFRAVMMVLRGKSPVRKGENWRRRVIREMVNLSKDRARWFRKWTPARKLKDIERFPSVGQWAKAKGLCKR